MGARKQFTPEFKREAVQLVESGSRPASAIARELGVRRNQLYKWQTELRRGRMRGQVLQSDILQWVTGIWSIWILRSVSFVWFDERERQERPAHQIDCL
jgi:hypothetical protein